MRSARREVATTPPAEAADWMSPDYVPGLVSVIIPTYNRKPLLLEALASVAAQTWRPIELVTVDDGSTDGTREAAEAWFESLSLEVKHGLVLRVVTQANGGAARARNLGLLVSRGEFIQFLDSDDLLHPRKLESQAGRLQADPELQYAYSSMTYFSSTPDWAVPEETQPPPRLEVEHLLDRYFLNTAVGVYRRSICVAIGPWNAALRASDDMEYNLRMIMATKATAFVPGTVFAHRRHPGTRLTTGPAIHRLDDLRQIETLLAEAGRLDERVRWTLPPRYFRIGLAAACQGDAASAREAVRCGLRHPCATSRGLKLRLLAVLSSIIVPRPLQRVLAQRMMAFARRHA